MKPPVTRAPGAYIPDVFVRHPMPATAAEVFALMTTGEGLQLWLCDEATSDVREGGQLRATWRDPMHPEETVVRRGTWVEVEADRIAYLRWDDPSPDAHPDHPEMLKIALADDGPKCVVTVMSPCPQQFERTTIATVQDATRQSWIQLLTELAKMLRSASADAPSDASNPANA